ncbi:MAG: MBG domain-containing protein [Tepidisphaerales bacterium]
MENLESRTLLSALAWSPGTSLPIGRADAAVLNISYGAGILLVGGTTASGSDTAALLLDPTTNTWVSAAAIDQGRAGGAIGETGTRGPLIDGTGDGTVFKYTGDIFIYGGAEQGTPTRTAINYDPANVANQVSAPSMNAARFAFASATDPSSGALYAIGGMGSANRVLASAEVYSPSADSWSPVAPLPQALYGAAGVPDGGGHIFVFGGDNAAGAPVPTVYRYTIATNRWDAVANMPLAVSYAAAVKAPDDRIYVLGGLSATGAQANVESFDPANNTWTAETPLPAPVYGAAAVTDAQNNIQVIGGHDSTGTPVTTVSVGSDITPAQATHLAILQGIPSGTILNQNQQMTVVVEDANGNIVGTSGTLITLATSTSFGSGSWLGNTQAFTVGGEAFFSGSFFFGGNTGVAGMEFSATGLTGAGQTFAVGTTQVIPSVLATGGTFGYDGSAHPGSAVALAAGGTPVAGSFTFTYNGSPQPPTVPGTYSVVASFTSNDPAYGNAIGNTSITINPATPTVVFSGGAFALDGLPHSATAAALGVDYLTPVAGALTFTYNGSPTPPSAAGTYSVLAAFTSSDPSYTNATGAGTITIGASAALPTLTVFGGTDTYDGSTHAATATAVASDGVTPVAGAFTYTYNGSPTPPSAPGVYAVLANFTSGDPAYASSIASGTLAIDGAVSTVTVTGGTFAYDAAAHVATATAVGVDGVTPLDGAFSFTYNGGPVPPSAPGTYAVVATFVPIDPSYSAASGYATLSIHADHIAPTLLVTGGTFTFDGTAHAPASAIAVGTDGLAPVNGSFTFTYNGSLATPSNAGSYDVLATFSSADPNYSGGTTSATMVINPAAPTVKAVGGTITWDGNPHPAIATAVGVDGATPVAGTFAITYNGAATAPVNPGAYAVVATFTSSDPNYTGGSASATLTIPDPTIPTGVTAVGSSTTSITVSWNPVGEPAGGTPTYSVSERIYHPGHGHSGRGGGYTPPYYSYTLEASGLTTTSYTVTGVSGPAIHTYVVVSVDNGITSAQSALVSAAPLYAPAISGFLLSGAVWSGSTPLNVTVGQTVTLSFASSGNAAPTFALVNGPATMSVNPTTGAITYTATPGDLGALTANFSATNSVGTATASLLIHVFAVSNTINSVAGIANTITIQPDANGVDDDVWVNVPTTGTPTQLADRSQPITVNSGGLTDTLVLSASGASPLGPMLILNGNYSTGNVTIPAGSTVRMVGNQNQALFSTGLSIANGGVLDMEGNDLVLQYSSSSPIDTVSAYIRDGQIGAGPMIVSTIPALAWPTTIGVVDNNTIHQTTWDGQTVSDGSNFNQILTKRTLLGDANLDGKVDQSDYLDIIANMGRVGATYFQGDLDGDGVVTANDLAIVSANLGAGASPAAGPLLPATSPATANAAPAARTASAARPKQPTLHHKRPKILHRVAKHM